MRPEIQDHHRFTISKNSSTESGIAENSVISCGVVDCFLLIDAPKASTGERAHNECTATLSTAIYTVVQFPTRKAPSKHEIQHNIHSPLLYVGVGEEEANQGRPCSFNVTELSEGGYGSLMYLFFFLMLVESRVIGYTREVRGWQCSHSHL